ncbi:hypothetical protein CIW49_26315 [Mycolicibacterium sp. P1-18]|uniref:hypothetical protein n=1 Tax=Mycolicibacterium sp. P1-18 TaxID=2024615 RepID=UPI0011F1F9F8|nr:hypothetical protein [Mycolicibacterium sp. P1-18]KAA0093580.1 hypothetical protein CIW49_26315 [Mycolicibacterium sp. P1-18]
MYQLTIDAAQAVTVTSHPDHAAAHRQLMRHVVRADYYLQPVATGPTHSAYDLLALAQGRRRPRRAGRATIDEVAADRVRPEDAPPQPERAPT